MQNITTEQIQSLVWLQQVDNEIQQLMGELDELPANIESLDDRLRSHENLVVEAESLIETKRKKYREMESEVQENLNKIQKSNNKLPSVKTNKEYHALLKEIDDIKKLNSQIEDEMLEYLDFFDSEEAGFKQKKAAFGNIKEEVEREKKAFFEKQQATENKLQQAKADYEKFVENVDPGLLKKYNVIRSQGHRTVISEVKHAVCQGCHVGIPPQLYNELQKGDVYTFCHNCQRMIYFAGNK